MDTSSNPSPTRSGGAAGFECSEPVFTGAVAGIGSPKHRSNRGGTSSVAPGAVTQVIRIGEVESIVPSTGIVISGGGGGGSMEVGTSGVANDWSPRRHIGAAATTAAMTDSWGDDGSGEAQQESAEYGSSGGNAVKKPAWNKLSNVANPEVVAPSVMGAESWPALSESTRASPKSLSSESLKASSDVLLSAAQGTGTAVVSSPKQEKNSHAIPNSTPNHAPFNRQRSMKRGGGNSSSNVVANGGSSQLPSRSSGMDAAPNNSGRQGTHANESASSSKDGTHQDSGHKGGSGSHSDGGNGHQPQRNSSFRRGNGGSHSRGEGYHHNGFGGRRSDQDRGSHDWNSNRSFPVRDSHLQPQRGPLRPSIRGPPTPPFILPPQVAVHPYSGMPVMYPDMQPVMYFPGPDPYRPVALGPPMAPMIYAFPNPDAELQTRILSQIEYYFSNDNLIKDMFLRQRMDDQGWVHINLIANFKKVKQLTDNIPLILDVLRSSNIVEVEGEKVRRRDDWSKWIMPVSVPQYTAGSSSAQSTEDTLSLNLQNTTLDDKAAPPRHVAEKYLSSSSSGEWSSSYTMQPSQVQFPTQGGSDASAALDSR